ncbi:MAG: NUDIX domain-containing protein [Nanoarchaeota archaeon]
MDENKFHYVVATGIIIKDKKYLITKRADWEKAFPGKWTVPGGKLEVTDYKNKPKDTSSHWYNILETLLKREVNEETGLYIKNINYLTSMTFIRPDNIPVLIVSLYADHDSGEVELSKDMVEHAWVSLEEAKNYDLIEGIYEEIMMLDDLLKNRKENVGEWKKEVKDGI